MNSRFFVLVAFWIASFLFRPELNATGFSFSNASNYNKIINQDILEQRAEMLIIDISRSVNILDAAGFKWFIYRNSSPYLDVMHIVKPEKANDHQAFGLANFSTSRTDPDYLMGLDYGHLRDLFYIKIHEDEPKSNFHGAEVEMKILDEDGDPLVFEYSRTEYGSQAGLGSGKETKLYFRYQDIPIDKNLSDDDAWFLFMGQLRFTKDCLDKMVEFMSQAEPEKKPEIDDPRITVSYTPSEDIQADVINRKAFIHEVYKTNGQIIMIAISMLFVCFVPQKLWTLRRKHK